MASSVMTIGPGKVVVIAAEEERFDWICDILGLGKEAIWADTKEAIRAMPLKPGYDVVIDHDPRYTRLLNVPTKFREIRAAIREINDHHRHKGEVRRTTWVRPEDHAWNGRIEVDYR